MVTYRVKENKVANMVVRKGGCRKERKPHELHTSEYNFLYNSNFQNQINISHSKYIKSKCA